MSALVVILSPEGGARWLRIADGEVVARGNDDGWGGDGEPPERALLIVPAAAVALHRATLPELAPRQAAVAARLMATENSLGSPERLHVATGPRQPDGAIDVAVVGVADMTGWLDWASLRGLDPGPVVPAALLLPRPDSGFVRGPVGDEDIARDAAAAFALDPVLAPLVLGDADVTVVGPAEVDAAIVAALDLAPLDLRQGPFARRRRRAFDWALVRRAGVLAGLILLASLVIALFEIARLDRDTARLDADALAAAQTVIPGVGDVAQAESALDARATAVGVGGRGFGAATARLFAALDQSPAATLTTFEATPDGALHATVAAPLSNDIDIVVAALRGAGATVEATPAQPGDGRQTSSLTVTPR